jgi:transposase-like protein
MPRAGRPKVRQYSLEFKLKAVKLSQLPGVEVQAVWRDHEAAAAEARR